MIGNPGRAFMVWLSTQIIALFVMLQVIPQEVADEYARYLADGLTYLTMAGSSFYYMKRLHDAQKLPHIPKETIEELLKRGLSRLPHRATSDPKLAEQPVEEILFHDANAVFSQDPEEVVSTENSTNTVLEQGDPKNAPLANSEQKS